MDQFEYQIVEQAGGRVSHLNDRITQLVHEGWEPHMMSGVSPHISLLMRRVATTAAQTAAQAPVAPPVQPRPPGQG